MTNAYDTSDSSEVNLDEAVYQSAPSAYAGTYTASSVTKNSATISWTALTTAASYGYASITGWKYGYKIGSGSYTFGTTTSETTSVSLSSLTASTTYTFFVEPLNAYQLTTDITDMRGTGTTFTTTSTKPASPTLVNVTRSTSTVTVEWVPVTSTNAVSSYSVTFKDSTSAYVTLAGICQVTSSSCGASCSCTVPMTTLTSTLGWTASTDTSINVRVTATNIDGTSDPADETNTIKYLYIPQAAPGLTVSTTSDTAASITVNCLTGQNAGRFADSDTLSYIVSYKPTSGSTWTNLTAVSCSYGTDTTKSVTSPTLTAVTTYQF